MKPLSHLTRNVLLDTAGAAIRSALDNLGVAPHDGHIQNARAHLQNAIALLDLAETRPGPP